MVGQVHIRFFLSSSGFASPSKPALPAGLCVQVAPRATSLAEDGAYLNKSG